MVTGDHPLAMVTGDEITRAVEIIRGTGRLTDEARFAHVVLHEPTKAALATWKLGDPVDRELRALVVPGPELLMIEVIVSVTAGEIRDWREIEGMRPALLFLEAMNAIFTTKEHPDYIAALARRGITDLDTVQIDPWPAGSFGFDAETDRRIARCISFVRETPDDNGYARPIEGVLVHFDLGRKR
jgi:primary-amine oxidase